MVVLLKFCHVMSILAKWIIAATSHCEGFAELRLREVRHWLQFQRAVSELTLGTPCTDACELKLAQLCLLQLHRHLDQPRVPLLLCQQLKQAGLRKHDFS